MIELFALATAIAVGVVPCRVALLAAALYLPLVVVAMALVSIWRGHRDIGANDAAFCDAVAAELRSGRNLRDALGAAGETLAPAMAELGRQGAPLHEFANVARDEFDDVGSELALTIERVWRSGSAAADIFEEIGSLAIAEAEVANEVRVASVPARATALVFVGAPILYLGWLATTGGVGSLLADQSQRIVSIVGILVFAAGVLVAGSIMWRAR